MAFAKKHDGPIEIRPPKQESFMVTVRGTAPLIVHKFDEKSRRQMLDAQMNGKRQAKTRDARDPQAEFKSSMYRIGKLYGFPAAGFKKAMISACRYGNGGLTMTAARGAFFVHGDPRSQGELVQIEGEPQMRADMVRLENGTPMERFRPEFREWRAKLLISFNPEFISAQSIVSLLTIAGTNVGVGERRPEKEGAGFGTFEISTEKRGRK